MKARQNSEITVHAIMNVPSAKIACLCILTGEIVRRLARTESLAKQRLRMYSNWPAYCAWW